ncbi:hypothetical protein BGX27_004654 [Mortierella sp. AM989]|nr:hypothetical protein BGX27_004654 [Mortierella sp. AM989]
MHSNRIPLVPTALLAILAVLSVVLASHRLPKGRVIAIKDAAEYCILLPPVYGGRISDYSHNAVSYCKLPMESAPSRSRELHEDFGMSVTWYKQDGERGYEQITGVFNRKVYGFSKRDAGGQYDSRHPSGSRCAGYKYFVQLVEPDVGLFCLRCCHNKEDCPTDKPTLGCRVVIPGGYETGS